MKMSVFGGTGFSGRPLTASFDCGFPVAPSAPITSHSTRPHHHTISSSVATFMFHRSDRMIPARRRVFRSLFITISCSMLAVQTQAQLTEEDRAGFLAEHNAYRAEVGARPLIWDPNLEAIAQEWAEELAGRPCEWGASFRTHRSEEDPDECSDTDSCWYDQHALSSNFDLQSQWIGENLRTVVRFSIPNDHVVKATGSKAGSSSSYAPGQSAVSVTNAWTDEKVDWNFGGVSTSGCAQDGVTGHYTAVVWADSTHVGCGKAFCTDTSGGDTDGWVIGGWVCNYFPGGNFRGKYPYCHANNPSGVGTCGGFEYDASKEPSYCEASTRSCDETGETQCSDSEFSRPGDGCDESGWPDKDHGLVCGNCKVLVDNFDTNYGTCANYCAAVGRACVGGWEEDGDTCGVLSTLGCEGAISSSDAICECQADAVTTAAAAVTTSVEATPAGEACSLELTWTQIDAAETAGTSVYTGGLGRLIDADHHTWLCIDSTAACPTTTGDLACFKYSEPLQAFEWYGFNSDLAIVVAS